jgi:predicted metal-dependent hydrolase
MVQPKLVWNRALTGSKFGHYRPSADTVMLSVSLDSSAFPGFVLDFVMYHELLHKKHAVAVVNGRRIVHSAAFRAEERKFEGYREAERLLKELARRS